MPYTKNDIFILNAIREKGGSNELEGVPISTIVKKTKLSHTKIRNTVRVLLSNSLISEGFMQKNAKTYFITEDGQKLLDRLIESKERVNNE